MTVPMKTPVQKAKVNTHSEPVVTSLQVKSRDTQRASALWTTPITTTNRSAITTMNNIMPRMSSLSSQIVAISPW